jgi:dihydroorotase
MDHVFAMMEELSIPLLVHGETHGFVMDREAEFCEVYRELATRYPTLQITMEHITTMDALQLLEEFSNLRATVTMHHQQSLQVSATPLQTQPLLLHPNHTSDQLHPQHTAHPRLLRPVR